MGIYILIHVTGTTTCMYTLYVHALLVYIYLRSLVEFFHGFIALYLSLKAAVFVLAEWDVPLCRILLKSAFTVGTLDVVRVGLGGTWRRYTGPCTMCTHLVSIQTCITPYLSLQSYDMYMYSTVIITPV